MQVAAAAYLRFRKDFILNEFRNFLELPYAELEDLNLMAKEQRK